MRAAAAAAAPPPALRVTASPSLEDTAAAAKPLRSGALGKKRNIGWQQRHFVLDSMMLSYYAAAGDAFPSGFVSLKEIVGVRLVPEKDKGRRFEVELHSRILVLLAASAEDAAGWVAAVEGACAARPRMCADRRRNSIHRVGGSPAPSPSATAAAAAAALGPEPVWDAVKNMEELARHAGGVGTDFRLAFYKAAKGRTDFMKRLVSDFRTDEQVLRLVLQVLIDPAPAAGAAKDSWLRVRGGAGGGSRSSRTFTASTMEAVPPDTAARLRASGCSRLNPDCHATSLNYRRAVPVRVSVVSLAEAAARTGEANTAEEESAAGGGGGSGAGGAPGAGGGARPEAAAGFSIRVDTAAECTAPAMPGVSPASSRGRSGGGSACASPSSHRRTKSSMRSPLGTPNSSAPGTPTSGGGGGGGGGGDGVGSAERGNAFFCSGGSGGGGGGRHVRTLSNYQRNAVFEMLMRQPKSARGHRSMAARGVSSGRRQSRDDLSLLARGGSGTRTAAADSAHPLGAAATYLTPHGYAEVTQAERQLVYDWAQSDDFLVHAARLFSTADVAVHRLALRAVWLLLQRAAHRAVPSGQAPPDGAACPECAVAADQLSEFVRVVHADHVPSVMQNHNVNSTVSALLSVLTTAQEEFNDDALVTQHDRDRDGGRGSGGGDTGAASAGDGPSGTMGRGVRNHGVWKAVFTSLAFSEFHTRRRSLFDINGVLIQRPHNCESLLSQAGWQRWVLPLLRDVPRNVASNRVLAKTYMYTVNVFALLHHHAFSRHHADEGATPLQSYADVMRESLRVPAEAAAAAAGTAGTLPAGGSAAPLSLMRAFLDSQLTRVRSLRNAFLHPAEDSVVWRNLAETLRLVRLFVFATTERHVANPGALFGGAAREPPRFYGLHAPAECRAQDAALIESVVAALQAARPDLADASDPEVPRGERDAVRALLAADEPAFARDAFVFVPTVARMGLTDGETSELVRDFLAQPSAERRRKVFRAAGERNQRVLAEQHRAERRLSKLIEKNLARDGARHAEVRSLLLLGAGESGKSTVFKQMQQCCGSGHGAEERAAYASVVHANVLGAARTLSEQSRALDAADVPCCAMETNEAREAAARLSAAADEGAPLTPALAADVTALWRDDGVRMTLHNRHRYQLACGDSVRYFFERAAELGAPGYVPTVDDLLRSRARTTGASEARLELNGVPFRITDVGGQRSERKKWMHQFADVTAVLFVAAISEYDQVLAEDASVNRLAESLDLFESVAAQPAFARTPIILFLNKCDIFARKIRRVPLTGVFPGFAKYRQDYKTACAYIQREFARRDRVQGREIICHVTCATDTTQMRVVFEAVKGIVLGQSLASMGLA